MSKVEIKEKLAKALKTCPHRETIKSLAIFGSYVRGNAGENSDLDVLIELIPESGIGFFELFDIQQALQSNVGIRIDLLTPQAISKYFRDKVLAEAEYIYEG
ncbi:MAG: nucleotidyltransferase family protein [Sedimentisphaerales bacterium]|nr:nucleotidyltransferase family protein [Sedimentisphaerales bacterium]